MAAQNPTGLWSSLQNLNIYVSLEKSFLEEKKTYPLMEIKRAWEILDQ
jgi:hypothetical protein